MHKKKLCVDCGTLFKPIRITQKRCHECVEKKRLAKKQVIIERRNKIRVCAVCKKEFKNNFRTKYCSDACARLSYKTKPKPEKMKINCLWCHVEMFTHSPNKRFCSSECNGQFQSAKKRIYKKYAFESEKCTQLLQQLEKEGKDFVL
jgi:hypothetical protein